MKTLIVDKIDIENKTMTLRPATDSEESAMPLSPAATFTIPGGGELRMGDLYTSTDGLNWTKDEQAQYQG